MERGSQSRETVNGVSEGEINPKKSALQIRANWRCGETAGEAGRRKKKRGTGLHRDSNAGPLADQFPKARIIPLDHRACSGANCEIPH